MIRNHVNDAGSIIDIDNLQDSFKTAEELCKSMIGNELTTKNGNKYYIRMLEIYYGSAGDDAHDWHRQKMFNPDNHQDNGGNHKRQLIQAKEGLSIYLKGDNTTSWKHNRMDIVVGPKNIALSFLLRSVWNNKFEIIGNKKNGSPYLVLKKFELSASDHGQEISKNKILPNKMSIRDTSEEFLQKHNLKVIQTCRFNLNSLFEVENNLKWNFKAVSK